MVPPVAIGQRHQREGPAGAVDLGRDAFVRQGMGHGEDHRLLPVAPAPRADADRLAHRAVAPVRGHQQLRPHLSPALAVPGQLHDHLAAARRHPLDPRRRDQPRVRQPVQLRHHLAPQQPVRQIVAEGLGPDLGRVEIRHLADRLLRPPGIGQPHHPQGRRMRLQPVPQPGPAQQLDRGLQEGGRAQVRALRLDLGHRRHRIDADRVEPLRREGRGRRQPGDPAARHQDVRLDAFHEPQS
jgi:hypothetical protein